MAMLTSEGLTVQPTLKRLFDTSWVGSSYYRTDWQCISDNLPLTGCAPSEVGNSFSAKACSVRAVPREERLFATTVDSRTQSHVPMMAGQPVACRDNNKESKDIAVTCIQCDNTIQCTGVSGQSIANFDTPVDSEPFGNWLLDAVLPYIDLKPGQRLLLLNSDGNIVLELQDEDPDVCIATHRYGDGTIAYFGDVNSEIETMKFVVGFCRKSKLVPFSIGSRFVVRGLKSKPETNGKIGEVVGYQGARIQVRLDDGEQTEMALNQANLEGISDA